MAKLLFSLCLSILSFFVSAQFFSRYSYEEFYEALSHLNEGDELDKMNSAVICDYWFTKATEKHSQGVEFLVRKAARAFNKTQHISGLLQLLLSSPAL
jgi:hypothetical protein